MMMPIEAKISNVKSDILKFVEISARDYDLPPFIITGILSDIINEWKTKEIVQINDSYNRIITTLNEQIAKEKNENNEQN
jgi:hypothetical protein